MSELALLVSTLFFCIILRQVTEVANPYRVHSTALLGCLKAVQQSMLFYYTILGWGEVTWPLHCKTPATVVCTWGS